MPSIDTIRIRDRRAVHQYSIHNTVIDQWIPIIGVVGLALYNLYSRLANHRDERSWPGYTLITQHLGISKTTVSKYNQILVWTGLIHIEPGTRARSNDYYILDIPEVTPELLEEIRTAALADWGEQEPLCTTLLKRLDGWKPIQSLWDHHKVGQLRLDVGSTPVKQGSTPVKQGSTPVKQGSTPVKQGGSTGVLEQSETTIQSNNPKQQSNSNNMPADAVVSILQDFGITDPLLSEIAPQLSPMQATALVMYVDSLDGLTNPPGFLVSLVRRGVSVPTEYITLAEIYDEDWDWLNSHSDARKRLGKWPDGLPVSLEAAELWFRFYGEESAFEYEHLVMT